jgi:type II secretory pathway pseudopilin PulG
VNNGKATWVAIIGIMLTMAGVIWRGGSTMGQIEQTNEGQSKAIHQLQDRVMTITDVLVKQARGKAQREELQRQIKRLRDQIQNLQRDAKTEPDTGPHLKEGSRDGGPRQQSAEKR